VKKVLAIAPYPFLPWFSGGQKFIAQFLQHLGNKVELTVVSVPSNDSTLATSYTLLPLLGSSFSRYYDASLVKKITTLIREKQFDTIIWEHPYYWWLAARIRKNTGIKTYIHTHNIEYQRFRSMGKWWWPVLRSYEKNAFKKADGIFFISPEDKNFAINQWKIESHKCIDLPFGIDIDAEPVNRPSCRKYIGEKHGIAPGEKILFFNGLLSYKPNIDAINIIIDKIDPLLQQERDFKYKILICGKDLPAELSALIKESRKIIYAGFTDKIEEYCMASDILLNPVLSGGGIKTKMVEAIGYGTTVISTVTGATGIQKEVCGNKLKIVPDNDWESFAEEILKESPIYRHTPSVYYGYYSWNNIIGNLVGKLRG
jgi:glycosyltransferase involved in cell wall biosynthesis